MIFLFLALVGITAFAVKAQAIRAQQAPVRVTETTSVKPLTKTDFYPTSKDVAAVSQMVTEGGPIIFNPVAKGGAPSSSAGVPPGAPGGAPSGAGGGGTGATGGRGVPNVY